MSQRTLVLLKPDAVRRGLVGNILSRFESKGLDIVALELRHIDAAQADAHYAEHVERDFYPPLRDFVTSGPLVAAVLEGDEAIEVVRALNGATDGRKAAAGHHPRRPVAVQPREPRARLGRRGVGRPRDQALVPRARLSRGLAGRGLHGRWKSPSIAERPGARPNRRRRSADAACRRGNWTFRS